MKRSLTTLTIALSSFTLVRCGGDAGTPAGGETGGGTGDMMSTTGTAGDATGSGASGDMNGQVGAGGSNSAGGGSGTGGNNESGGGSDGGITTKKDGGSSGMGGSGGSKGTGGDAGAQPYKGVANSSCSDLALLGASWFYDWGTGQAGCPGIEYVPMVWGKAAEQTAMGITSEIKTMVNAGYHTVLGFNEPDSNTQSNISATMAITLWPSFNNPAMRVISPATTSGGTAFPWMQTFMTAVNGSPTTMRVDAIAIHYYGWFAGSCDAKASGLESYITQIEGIPGNRPIWLTEFGCLNESNPSDEVVQAFMSGALAMFAKHSRVERFAWFPRNPHNELVSGGKLTGLGAIYAAAPSRK